MCSAHLLPVGSPSDLHGGTEPPEPLPAALAPTVHPLSQIGLQTKHISDVSHVDSEPISSLHVLLQLIFFFFNLLAVLGLCDCVGYSLVVVHGLLTVMASLIADHGL